MKIFFVREGVRVRYWRELGSERKNGTREHKCKTDDERLRPGNRLHEVRVAVGQYGPVHCPSFRPRGLSRLFLPVRGHNERFLASPIVPFRNVSFIPTIES